MTWITELRFEPVWPVLWVLLVLPLGGLLAWWQYLRPHWFGINRTKQILLFGLRVALFAVITLLLLNPQTNRPITRTRLPELLVLVDTSGSMFTRPDPDHPTGFQQLRDAFFKRLYPLWENKFRFKFFTFANNPASISVDDLREMEIAGGSATDLRTALRQALQQHGSLKPAAVLMLTDGNHNWGSEPTPDDLRYGESPQPVPFLAVSTESYGEIQKSLAIPQITVLNPVFAKEPTEIRYQLVGSGLVDPICKTELTISLQDEEGEYQQIDQLKQTGQVALSGPSTIGSFVTVFPEGGQYTVEIHASAAEVEPAAASREVRVEPGRLRIGLFAQRPGWNTANLVERLGTIPRFELRSAVGIGQEEWVYLTSVADESDQHRLQSLEEVASQAELLIFSELDDRRLALLPAQRIKERLAEGAAVLWIASPEVLPPANLLQAMGLDQLLPVSFQKAQLSPNHQPVVLTPSGRTHRITGIPLLQSLSDALPDSIETYSGVQLSDEGVALLNFSNSAPLLAVQTHGDNRTAYLGAQDLWRWRFQPGSDSARYWQAYHVLADNLLKWLLFGDQQDRNIPQLVMAQSRFPMGKPIDVEAYYARAVTEPTTELTLTFTSSHNTVISAAMQARPAGYFHAQLNPVETGEFLLRVADAHRPSASSELAIRVDAFSVETALSGTNQALLQSLAESSQGLLVDVEQITDLADSEDLKPIFALQSISKTVHEPLMSDPWFFVVLLILLAAEWILRRKLDLP